MANADCIIIQGSNMAECHPVGFQWVTEAKARGARVIHVDPRFTRTTAIADRHVPIRAGSDIVLLGALINRVLTEGRYFDEYVRAYTNAANLISDDYVTPGTSTDCSRIRPGHGSREFDVVVPDG